MASSSSSSAVSLFLFVMMLLVSNLPCCSMSLTYKNRCNEQCGVLPIAYPFYITQGCGAPGFGLHCFNSTLSLNLDNTQYTVLGFSTDSILIDPLLSACQRSVRSFNFRSNKYYAISRDNIIQLSGCKNSSAYAMKCNIPSTINRTECNFDTPWCAPLLNDSMWRAGDSISDFARFGCTYFSSWALSKPSVGEWNTDHGMKIEWGLPGGCSKVNCSSNASCVNATTVKDGVRCDCDSGYQGDGFANGVGCFEVMLLVSNLPCCSMSLTYKNRCNEQCGVLAIPYPFYITQGCGAPGFGLHCFNSTLSVKLDNIQYRVFGFSTDSILIDPLFTACQRSVHLFNFRSNKYYAISRDNFIQLSGCKNSSACAMNCNIPITINSRECKYDTACCAPLSNVSMWRVGDTISEFGIFGCTYFSSWALSKPSVGDMNADHGLKIEWGLPGGCSKVKCSSNASCVNATTVKDGVRCECDSGYEGDGFANGVECFKVCLSADGSTDCGDKRNGFNVSVLAGGLVAAVTIIASLVIAFALLRRYRSPSTEMERRSDSSQLAGLLSFDAKACTTRLFTYKELNKATKGFTEKLGNGACGIVYAGELPDGHLVAVKKIHFGSPQGAQQLFNEINVLSTVRHRNLVCLLGCCIEMDSPILVYDFVPNGTLSAHLERVKGEGLDWLTRITVATETATAIAYLHCAVNPPIYHRDVKSTNILLDYDYTAKVADFGLSRLGVPELSHISTIPQGTPGYLDPEYHQNFHLSDKSDVYSFGVVLIELITAMKPVDFSRDKKDVNLAVLAMSKIKSGCLDDIIDPFLQVEKRSLLRELVQRVAELAFRCLSYEKDSRPTMMEVAEELSQIKKASLNVTTPLAQKIYRLSLESINLPDVDASVKCTSSSWTSTEKSL